MNQLANVCTGLLLVAGVSGCDNVTELDLLDSPNQVSPDQAGVDFLYNSIQITFSEIMYGAVSPIGTTVDAGNTNSLFRFTSDLVRMTAMTASGNYENAFQSVYFNSLWTNVYAGLFPDVDLLVERATESGLVGQIGSSKVMKAYTMMMLVDIFGEVPYSQIGQGVDVIAPVADAGADVYLEAIALLDDAIVDLSAEDVPDFEDIDNFYGGDVEQWIKLANTLKLRAAVTTRLVSGTEATTLVNDLIADESVIIASAGDDWQWSYGTSRLNPSTRNPLYVDSYESTDGDYLGNYFMWAVAYEKLIADSVIDQRANYYFYRQEVNLVDDIEGDNAAAFDCINSMVPDNDFRPARYEEIDPNMPYCLGSPAELGYFGRDHGNNSGLPPDGNLRTVFGVYPAGGLFDDRSGSDVQNEGTDGALGEGIIPLMTSFYVNFLRAEAALTMGTNDDAAAQLEAGIRGSFAKVSGFAGAPAVDDSLTTVYVDYVLEEFEEADNSGKVNIVAKEFYLALWGQPLEPYNLYRRTCAPVNLQPTIIPSPGDFVQSAPYPAVYVERNQSAMQKPDQTVEVFWDTNGPDCNY